jgi:hypothetical protein
MGKDVDVQDKDFLREVHDIGETADIAHGRTKAWSRDSAPWSRTLAADPGCPCSAVTTSPPYATYHCPHASQHPLAVAFQQGCDAVMLALRPQSPTVMQRSAHNTLL